MFETLRRDIQAVRDRDPAARNILEVMLCYPGLHAIVMHRLSHTLWRWRLRLPARLLSHITRFFTGIDIHPGAKIGTGFFIDHGMGVVIGETAEVGNDVTMYQGATLGGTGKERGKRHPTIGDHAVISAGSKVLGSFRVGEYARIGAGAVVLKEVPANATVVGVPGRVVRENGERVSDATLLDHANLPDPVEVMFRNMLNRISQLEQRLSELEEESRTNADVRHEP
jgi:serine O-acetyltransferase